MQKYPFILRLLVVAPAVIVMGFVWAIIGIFSVESLGKVLKKTGENFLKSNTDEK